MYDVYDICNVYDLYGMYDMYEVYEPTRSDTKVAAGLSNAATSRILEAGEGQTLVGRTRF